MQVGALWVYEPVVLWIGGSMVAMLVMSECL